MEVPRIRCAEARDVMTLRALRFALAFAIASRLNEHALMMALVARHRWRSETGTLFDGTMWVQLSKEIRP